MNTRLTGWLASMCLVLVCALAQVARAAAEPVIVIDAGFLVDVKQRVLVPNARLLIRDGRIAAVAPRLDIPQSARYIDLRRGYVLPGFTDAHAHVVGTYDRKSRLEIILTQSSADNALIGLRNLQTLLHAGFTTVRIPGDKDAGFATIAIRNAINRGDFVGPRLFVAPHFLGPIGGHGDLNDVSPDWEGRVMGGAIPAGVASMQDAVRREVKYGADWIKVMATGGVMSQSDDPRLSAFSDEEFQALADEAHRLGVRIAAHAHGNAGAYAAVKAGFDSIEHGTLIDEKTIALMVKKGTFLVPTVYVGEWIRDHGVGAGVSSNSHHKALAMAEARKRSIAMAYAAGVKIVLGSDSVYPHEEAIREFAAMHAAGIATWDVLRAATITAAELLGKQDDLGSLEPGKFADIVAVPSDPIADITSVERVFFVMKAGQVIRADERSH